MAGIGKDCGHHGHFQRRLRGVNHVMKVPMGQSIFHKARAGVKGFKEDISFFEVSCYRGKKGD